MRKIIVTGATGFIGVHLVCHLLKKGYIVYAVVRPASRNLKRLPKHSRLKVIELDSDKIERLPDHVKNADAFYHLAWEGIRVPYRDDFSLQRKNYKNALKAINAAIQMKCNIFIGTGSQAEYGVTNGPVDEKYPCHPVSFYGKEKLRACHELEKTAKENRIRFIWLRIFSVYGRYDSANSLIMSSINKMRINAVLELTECKQNWDYIYVGDVAEAMVRFLEKKCPDGVYNVASGQIYPLRDYVEKLYAILKSRSIIKYGVLPYGENGVVSLEPVVDKINQELGWKAETPFELGVWKILNEDEDYLNEDDKYIDTNL